MKHSARMGVLNALGRSRIALAAILLAVLAGCTGDNAADDTGDDTGDNTNQEPVAESATFDDLRTARTCPLQVDASKLPADWKLDDQGYVYSNVYVDEEAGMVDVVCNFPIAGEGKQSEPVRVRISALPADSTGDLFSVDAFANLTSNETGVEMAQLQPTVEGLAVDEVAALQGNGEFLAVRPVEVEGASTALILVSGADGLSEDKLEAAAGAITW